MSYGGIVCLNTVDNVAGAVGRISIDRQGSAFVTGQQADFEPTYIRQGNERMRSR